MKSSPLLAGIATLTLAGGAFAADAASPGGSGANSPTLGRTALVELARTGQPLCGGWRPKDDSCEDIGFMEVLADGQVRQTYRFKLSDDYEIAMRQTVKFEGDALCAVFRWDEIDVVVLRDGDRAPMSESLPLTIMLQSSLEEFNGKTICETYQRDTVTGEITTTVTVDGQRDPALDADYRVLDKGDTIHLRGPDEGPELEPLDV
ncbi:hypothetical protein GVN21_10335 [Caulobacter sp. SLTY]|uniref:hypothetical protein n=1 Tax=Caulobacter sp. SLTY TaxID=2683262 RepID=UPI001412903D|nr:hypothetical protein [Caulobacter sp. SLTY]NBB15752.1 hypothetical protein [Caulobacter sp. SLTY]